MVVASIVRVTLIVVIVVAGGVAIIHQPVLTSIAFRGPARASPVLLRSHVDYLTNVTRPRSAHHPEQLDEAATYIAAAFRSSGARVSFQEFDARRRHYRNVVARFGPEVGALRIVGAHYDAFCETGDFPGADDNASGTAGLLELARLLGKRPPLRPVMLVAYSTEEPPFFGSEGMGSAVHAASLRNKGVDVDAMICLEMIGYYAGEQRWPSRLFAFLYPGRGDFIAVAGGWSDRDLTRAVKRAIRGAGGVDVCSFTGPRVSLDASDHRSYWNAGYRAVLVTDTADLRNPNYHTARDTADTLDYTRMAGVVEGVFTAAAR